MKIISLVLSLLVVAALSGFAADPPAKSKKLLHVVSFKFKPEAGKGQIDDVVAAFRDLQPKQE